MTQYDGPTNLTIGVQHRDETYTTWGTAGSFSPITAVGHSEVDITGLKQILRFEYSFVGGSADSGVHFVMQAPSFRPYP